MNEYTPRSHPLYGLFSADVEGFAALVDLALDMRWTWNHATDEIWRQLDPVLWELTHHPCDVLQAASREKIQNALADPAFRKRIDDLAQAKKRAEETPAWFQQQHPETPLTCVAYFSMEFMLSEALPIYAGGLGNVAGDQLKAASDLGVPVVGVGLLYQQGYLRQVLDRDGKQQVLYPYNDPAQMPITPVRQANGEWLRVKIDMPGYPLWLRAWHVQVGRVKLYLLDSNDTANFPAHRTITGELYGAGIELRLQQELVLGIGGWRLLSALGLTPEVCHLNEGHAAFAVLERARAFMAESGQPFDVALAVTRAGNLFSTHTAVAVGFDRFAPKLIEQYLGATAAELGITIHDLLALGRRNPDDSAEKFNMAYLAIRGSGAVNGVSRLHGQVSRQLFAPLFPGWPESDVPIGHITNGVHMSTWDSAAADELWTETCGKGRWLGCSANLEQNIRSVSDARLWKFRHAASHAFVTKVRARLSRQLIATGASPEAVREAQNIFDPNALTLGFARRFTAYKRPNLLLHDPERLLRLLSSPERPVQLVLAGMAHPMDKPGQALIHQWTQFIKRPEVRSHVIFLSDHNMLLSEMLVQGVDVWINTPRRPWEACGTSGMKVLVNGGLNLSELDGWWAEAYTPEVGWALGDIQEHGDDPDWDATEAVALYERLEQEVIPEFYRRDNQGLPTAWLERMRESMATLTPRFSASRSVHEYTEQHYLPAAAAYRERASDKGAVGRQMVDQRQTLRAKWSSLRIGYVRFETNETQHLFEAEVHLEDLDREAVRVELFADGLNGEAPERPEMQRIHERRGASGGYVYRALVSSVRPPEDYKVRIIPHCEGVAVPLEEALIVWQQ